METASPSPAESAPEPADFYRGDTYETNTSIGALMRRLVNALTQDIDRELDEHDLTNAQWAPLFKMSKGIDTVAELARGCQTDNGGMTRMLDRLEAKGFLRRVRSTTDRRVVNLELTPAGKSAADKVPHVLADVMNRYLAGFTHEEWLALQGYLRRMIDNAEAVKAQARSDNQE